MDSAAMVPRRNLRRLLVATVGALAIVPIPGALASYSGATQSGYTSSAAPEAVELNDLVPSPTYPNWYWSTSDVWKTTDTFAACAGLSGPALSDCQQVQRARLWAFQLDPTSHAIVAVRSFAVSDPAWALDPYIAQNNDWEDMTLGPLRTAADGTTVAANLIIGATGNAKNNPVYDASGTNITCDTRRLIELREPDLNDPTAGAWAPWKIYDIANYVGTFGAVDCNSEALVQAPDGNGNAQAYMVSRGGRKIFSRSLNPSTGRDPVTPRAAVGSGLAYEPSVGYVGLVSNSRGAQFTAVDTNGQDIAMVSPASSTKPCQLYRWTMTGATLATTITSVAPAKDAITCSTTEGVTFARDPANPSVLTRDLYTVSDSRTTLRYWYLPWN